MEFDIKILAIHRLRCNVKSLAAEAKFIRIEEKRCGLPAYRARLSEHRRGRLREESRYAQLALAYLRGKPYKIVEQKTSLVPDKKRLCDKISRVCENREAEVLRWLEAPVPLVVQQVLQHT